MWKHLWSEIGNEEYLVQCSEEIANKCGVVVVLLRYFEDIDSVWHFWQCEGLFCPVSVLGWKTKVSHWASNSNVKCWLWNAHVDEYLDEEKVFSVKQRWASSHSLPNLVNSIVAINDHRKQPESNGKIIVLSPYMFLISWNFSSRAATVPYIYPVC